MKPTPIFSVIFFTFILVLILSNRVSAIQGSDSSGTITSYSGTTGAAAASGSSSDGAVTGSRVSAGGSAVSSSYSDSSVSGSPGADLSTTDASTSSESGSGTQTETQTGESQGSSVGGGGGGGGGGVTSESEDAGAEQTTVEAEAGQEATNAEAETTTEQAVEAASQTENAVTVAIELTEGSSVTLAPQTGAAGMSVLTVTATTATIVITSESTNSITGGAIYSTDQETTMEVGETIDVDSDGDGVADLQITLSRIDYNQETKKYEGIFTLTYLNPSEEVVSFVREQVERGEVAFVKGPAIEELSFAYWIWIIIALIVIGVLALVGWVLFDKKNRKHFPTTIPTHYFEKLIRQEVSTHKKEEPEQTKKQEKQEVKSETEKGTAQIIVPKIKSLGKKKKRKKKIKKNKIKGRKRKTKKK